MYRIIIRSHCGVPSSHYQSGWHFYREGNEEFSTEDKDFAIKTYLRLANCHPAGGIKLVDDMSITLDATAKGSECIHQWIDLDKGGVL